MISIQKLMQNLMQCRESNLVLPKMNDMEDNPFVQKTAIDLRRMELEKVDEVFTQLNESNFTMDKELEEINNKLIGVSSSNGNSKNTTVISIAPESLIIYVENETAPLPEIILNLLRAVGNSPDEWYIYGVKNPESFYKSFLLLTQIDFIIKNKTEKKNEVATFKREMALHYETFYKTLEYRALRLPHNDMINKLTGMDNYCGYDALRFLCDYCQVNLILLDIIEKKYIDIRYTPNTINSSVCKESHSDKEYIIIIKYVAETYLPLMNSNGTHIFTMDALEWISQNFERLKVEKFKEPNQILKDMKLERQSIANKYETATLGDANELNLADIEEPLEVDVSLETDVSGNFLDSKTVSVFFNNTVPPAEEQSNMNSIIKTGGFTMAIEDMIEISNALEPLPISNMQFTSERKKQEQDVFKDLLDKIPSRQKPSSNSFTVETSKVAKSTKLSNTSTTLTPLASEPTPSNEELKPIKSYNLLDLQMLARLHKIDTQKDGKSGKKVNKTKEDMYSEIKDKLDKLDK